MIDTSYAERLANAIESIGGDDETLVGWAQGVRDLGTDNDRLRKAIETALELLESPKSWASPRARDALRDALNAS